MPRMETVENDATVQVLREGNDDVIRRHRVAALDGRPQRNLIVVGQRAAPEAETISDCLRPLGRVEYQLDPAAQHQINNVRAPVADFVYRRHRQALIDQGLRGAPRGHQREAHLDQLTAGLDQCPLILIAHRDKDAALEWQVGATAELRLGEGATEIGVEAHHFAG